MPETEAKQVIRFGTFEVDPRTGELRKNGLQVKLQDQPFQVLLALLERPGEVVTREELRAKLWPADTFVDFDHGLNAAVKRLREALGDTAENPRFVETLPRRGYRFIAPVEGGGEKSAVAQPFSSELDTAAVESGPRIRKHWRVAAIAAGAILCLVLAFGIWLALPQPQPRVLNATQLTSDGKGKCCLVTDGLRIYFTEWDEDGSGRIKSVPVTGGDPIAIPTLSPAGTKEMQVQDISPEHDRLLAAYHPGLNNGPCPLWVFPLSGSSPRPLTDATIETNGCTKGASWSPDGQMLALSHGSDLAVARADGTESRKIASTKGAVLCPLWSPDGKMLRFAVEDAITGKSSPLLEVSVLGGEPRRVLPAGKPEPYVRGANWTADRRYFVFSARDEQENRSDLLAIREHRFLFERGKHEPIRLTAGPISFVHPAFSPDGKRLFAIGISTRGESQRYDRKSGQFVPLRPALSADCCVYSKDSQWMTYVSYPDGSLWRSKSDGGQRQQLTWPPMRALNPHWSPDGKQIAFSGQLPGRTWKTFIIPAEGGSARQLTQDECPEAEANWSPDGTQIVFGVAANLVSGTSCPVVVYISDLKTHQRSILPGSNQLSYPRWSPDGGRIVAQNTGAWGGLLLYDLSTQKWSELAKASFESGIGYPQWSPDGELVYFRILGQKDGVYSIRITDHKTEKIADLSAINTFGTCYQWSAVDPQGNPLILRAIRLNEIYALDFEAP